MAVKQSRTGGKRIRRTTYAQKRRTYQTYSQAQRGGRRQAKETEAASVTSGEKRRLRQLVVSAAILVAVVAIKLASPQTLQQFRGQLLELMGTDTDFAAVFSTVGEAVTSEDGLKGALNDAYVAVFGTENGTDESESGGIAAPAGDMPENAYPYQKVLGFAYIPPLEGSIGSDFGYRTHPIDGDTRFHYGLDFEAESGTVISCFADGTVTAVGESSALGKYVTVQHADGYTTLYAHCRCITASSGQQVRMGDPIAEVGDTGQTTGPHLHFELCQDTVYLNPIYYVAQ